MSSSHSDELVAAYLARLERELVDLPRTRRRELVDEIAAHIAEARSELTIDGEAELRTILDQLGDPAEIAADARERLGRPRGQGRSLEIIALVLLLAGGRDKVIGTLVPPGGLLAAAFLAVFGGTSSGGICVTETDPATGRVQDETCTGGPSTGAQVLGVALLVVLVVAPLVTTAYLARRMSRRPAAALA
jgi:uncharacterized membrane protein